MLRAARDVVICRGIRWGQPPLESLEDPFPIAGVHIACDLLHKNLCFLRVILDVTGGLQYLRCRRTKFPLLQFIQLL
jgi:hypothetical protein